MRVETNLDLVKRNRRLAHGLFFASMIVLIGGFLLANLQLTAADETSLALAIILPWLVLPLGFIATMASVRMTNLWIRRPRPEDALREGLKGMSKRAVLYNYLHFPARHVLIAPQGVFAITTRFQEGKFRVEGDKWGTPGGPLSGVMRFLRRDGIGNPTEDALRAAAYIKEIMDEVSPGVEVHPLIVFVDPRAEVEIINPTVPVLYTDDRKKPNLRDYMRDLANEQEKAQADTRTESKKKGKKGSSAASKNGASAFDPEAVITAFEEATVILE